MEATEEDEEEKEKKKAIELKLASLSRLAAARGTSEEQQQQQQDDLYILLAKKDQDLKLAAELGKVLLEKNDELSRLNERMAEDYSRKLETLEQEKHSLRRQLEQKSSECEHRTLELEADCKSLGAQLEQQKRQSQQTEKQKSKLIDELAQQNQRLTAELAELSRAEELLSSQLEQVNERLSLRASNRDDHQLQATVLKDEVELLNQRKQDLERRLKSAQTEKLELARTLDQLGQRLLELEAELAASSSTCQQLESELHEAHQSAGWLAGKLEQLISINEQLLLLSSGGQADEEHQRQQLQHQLHCDTQTTLSETERLRLAERLQEIRQQAARAQAHERQLARVRHQQLGSELAHGDCAPAQLLDVFAQLTRLDSDLRRRQHSLRLLAADRQRASDSLPAAAYFSSSSSHQPDDSGVSSASSTVSAPPVARGGGGGSSRLPRDSSDGADQLELLAAAQEPDNWRRLIHSIQSLIEDMPCTSCHSMISERVQLEQLQRLEARARDQLRRKDEQVAELSGRQVELERQVAELEQQVAILREDLNCCQSEAPRDQIVQLAWQRRDEAVARKNGSEIALAKARIENMQLASQLLEVVQQKGELSLRLAEFEDDLHLVMQNSLRTKFEWHNEREHVAASSHKSEPTSGASPMRQLLLSSIHRLRGVAASDPVAPPGGRETNQKNFIFSNHRQVLARLWPLVPQS